MSETLGQGWPGAQASEPAEAAAARIAVIIPAHNEDRFIGSVVLKARAYARTVVVVDDGSEDQTAAVAEAAGARVVRHAVNQGKGGALNTGLEEARTLEADVVVFMDADGQHDAADIPALAAAVLEQGADIVTGSRFLERPNQAPAYRQLGQRALTLLTNATSHVKVTDTWSGFRALSARAAQVIRFQETGWGIEPEIQFQARKYGLTMCDVPVAIAYHEPAKRNPVKHALQTLQGLLRLVGRHRPILLFFGIGACGVLLGLALGVWVINRYLELKMLAGGIALLSVSLVLLGALTLYTALIIWAIRGKHGRD